MERLRRLCHRIVSDELARDASLGAGIGLLAWPVAVQNASPGVDVSWVVGLHLAAQQRFSFGSEIDFTFGPLGFLGSAQPYVGWTSALSLAFVGGVHIAACVVMYHLVRQALGYAKAFALVLSAAFTFPWIVGWPMYGILIFLAGAAAVCRRQDRPTGFMFALGMGAAAGAALLGKLNIGAVSLIVAAVAVVASARDWRRSVAVFGASTLATSLGLWLLLGQRLVDLPTYIRAAYEVTAGYGYSMGMVDPATHWALPVAALMTGVLAVLVWQRASILPRRDVATLGIVFSIVLFVAFKSGFTRAGTGFLIYLATLLALWPVVVQRTRSWITAALPVVALLSVFLAVGAMPAAGLFDPVSRLKALKHEVVAALQPGQSSEATRAALRSQYNLPQEALALLAGHTVDIEPWEAAVAYAYPEIQWRPQPVFQAYSAYTPYLDHLNAQFLAGSNAPERMLWLTPPDVGLSIDYRSAWFDAPEAKIEMVCRYLPMQVTPTWQVLGRVADRCGQAQTVATVTTTAGSPVTVPSDLPPGIVTVRVSGVAADLGSQLRALAYKAPPWFVAGGQDKARVPLGTTSDREIIGTTTDLGYSEALALSPPPDTITIGPDPGASGYGSPLTVVFEVFPVTHAP